MNYTREPIIETVLTPRSGCKLVVRNSKAAGQEEYFVDAIEIVSFGSALFYRSTERPKSFLVPVSDYEVFEVKETRLVLKHVSGEKNKQKTEGSSDTKSESKRKDRRRAKRRRSAADKEVDAEVESVEEKPAKKSEPKASVKKKRGREKAEEKEKGIEVDPMEVVSAIIPPPSTLVSDILGYERLDNEAVKQAVAGAESPKLKKAPQDSKKKKSRKGESSTEKEVSETKKETSDSDVASDTAPEVSAEEVKSELPPSVEGRDEGSES